MTGFSSSSSVRFQFHRIVDTNLINIIQSQPHRVGIFNTQVEWRPILDKIKTQTVRTKSEVKKSGKKRFLKFRN